MYGQWPVEAFEVSGEISSYDGRGFCAVLVSPAQPSGSR